MSSVPAGAVIFLPSTVMVTSAIFAFLGHYRNFFVLIRTGLAIQVILELTAPLVHDRDSRDCGSVAQRTEASAQDVQRKPFDIVDVLFDSSAGVETGKRLLQPVRAFAA